MKSLDRQGAARVCWVIVALCFVLPSIACQPPTEASAPPPVQGLVIKNPVGDRPTFFDLGEVAFGEQVKHVFQIQNCDPVPVTINDMLPSCGCTVARISYQDAAGQDVVGSIAPGARVIVLPPGVVAHLTLSVDTTHVETMNRDKLTQVRLRTDSKNTPYLTLEMHLLVRRAFRSVPDRIELGESPRSSGKSGRADITVEDRTSSARIRAVESIEGPFEATVDATTVSGIELWILVVTPKPDLPLGPVRGRVALSTTRDDGTGDGPPFLVSVSAQITADVVLHPPLFALKSSRTGPEFGALVELAALVPGQRVKVRGTKLEGVGADVLRVECTPVDADDQGRASTWRIALQAPPDSKGQTFSGKVTIELDHPGLPKLEAPYMASSR